MEDWRKRLPKERERQLDTELAARGLICVMCGQPITKWCQVGTGWVSSFSTRCRQCGKVTRNWAHNYCVPWPLRDYSWLRKLAQRLSAKYDDHYLLRDCPECPRRVKGGPTASRQQIGRAIQALDAVQGYGLDCATLANLVGYALQEQGITVMVIEGETPNMPVHYWLFVDGKRVDPWAAYYDIDISGYVMEDRYPVYGPQDASGGYIKGVWEHYLTALGQSADSTQLEE